MSPHVMLVLGMLGVCTGLRILPTEPSEVSETTARPQGPASFWITYSKKIRLGHPMHFQVHILKGSSPVEISITLRNVSGSEVFSQGPFVVNPGDPQGIKLNIPLDMKKPDEKSKYYWNQYYGLEVVAVGSEVNFTQKGSVRLAAKAFSIFVQTDKAMYKPSQTVRFRVLAMTPDMKVLSDVKQDIVVMDSKGNRILQFIGLEATENMGVVQKSFNLASSIPYGTWNIQVTIEGVEEKKTFEVSDYVLPRFEVTIAGPSYGITTDPLYEFTVSAKYTFGKPVTDGEVDIAVQPNYVWMNIKPLSKRGKLNSTGQVKVQITRQEFFDLYKEHFRYSSNIPEYSRFTINANVTEPHTKRVQTASHQITFYRSPIKMSFLGITQNSFKSGLDFTAYIEVKKRDDSLFTPEEARNIYINISATYEAPKPPSTTTTSQPTTEKEGDSPRRPIPIVIDEYAGRWNTIQKQLTLDKDMYRLPDNGWVVITFRVPDEATSMNLKASSVTGLVEAKASFYASKSRSPTNSFLQLRILNKKVKVGEMVKLQAKATDGIKILNYQVLAKGQMLVSEEVSSSSSRPAKSLEFEFEATAAMAPSMSVVAFYVRDDGEFVVDALSLSVDGLFNNPVSIKFNKEKIQPGEKVDLIVEGDRNSALFVLAVDKSVKLLKSGNDITQEMVIEELAKYSGNYGFWRYMFICGWPSYFGGSDAASVLESANVGVMTDGLIYRQPWNTFFNAVDTPEVMDTAAGGSDANRNPDQGVKTRKLFPENWLWSTVIISQEYVLLNTHIPQEI